MNHEVLTRERNWCGNYDFTARCIHRPDTIDAVQRLVAAAPRIRAVGSRHSFNGIADSPGGELIDLGAIPPDFRISHDRATVTVGAGTSYAVLAAHLHAQGFALHNLASLPHITVAGAIATGTHGSGDRNAPLSGAVAGLELVAADGSLVRVARGDADFDAAVVGLGAFGIVVRVALDIGPTFDVRQDSFVDLPWDALLDRFDALSSAAYSVSVMTKWGRDLADRIWLKTRLGDASLRDAPGTHLGLIPGAPVPVEAANPAGRPTPYAGLTAFGGVPGPWSERLTHFRPDALPGHPDQIQSEYMLPRSRLRDAVAAVRAMAARIDPVLHGSEIRTMAGDAPWLSPAHGQDTVALHFTWRKQPDDVDRVTRALEAALIPLGARPHWGKLMHAPAATLAPLYPRFADFKARATAHDPRGKFRNPSRGQ